MNLLWPSIWIAGAFVVASLAALLLRRVALAGVQRWMTSSEPLVACADAFRGPSLWWCGVVGLWAANQVAEDFAIVQSRWHRQLETLLAAAIILSISVTLSGVVARVATRAAQKRLLGGSVTSLAQTTARAAVLVVGLLILLSTAGVQVTPILATLGIGGLAVALALQDTLLNVFAGIHLLADRPLRVGDYVKVGDQAEGFVTDVGWRSTRIRSLSNHVLVLPNQAVARATITNYDLPEPREAMGMKVSVAYSADPERVEQVLLDEVTRRVGRIPGLLADPAPSVSLIPGPGTGSLDFTVDYNVASFMDQYPVQHELRKRILQRLQQEGLTVPVPTPVA